MACDSPPERLDAYVDDELSAAEASSVRDHLRNCPSCAADALSQIRLRRKVADAGVRYQPASELRNKIVGRYSTRARPRHLQWAILTVPALVVLLVILSANFFVAREKMRQQRVLGEVADLHIAALASASPVDVLSTDQHTVKPWFEGKIPFTFNLPDVQGSDFTLRGGRVTYLAQSPGAQLIYQLRKHSLSVFIFQDRAEQYGTTALEPVEFQTFHVESWNQHGLRYFIVGDVNANDIQSLSKLFRDAG